MIHSSPTDYLMNSLMEIMSSVEFEGDFALLSKEVFDEMANNLNDYLDWRDAATERTYSGKHSQTSGTTHSYSYEVDDDPSY